MLTPFLKYVSEGKVIRRHSDLQRYTFPEVTERIYLSFLALSVFVLGIIHSFVPSFIPFLPIEIIKKILAEFNYNYQSKPDNE